MAVIKVKKDGNWDTITTIQGEQGLTGQDGQDGQDGAVFTPSVSSDGVLSWTNDGGLENPPSINIKGPKGDTGSIDFPSNLTIVQNQSTIENKGKITFNGSAETTVEINEPVLVECSKEATKSATLTGVLPNISALYDGLIIKMFLPQIDSDFPSDSIQFKFTLADNSEVTEKVYKSGAKELTVKDVTPMSYASFVYSTDYSEDETVYKGWRLIGGLSNSEERSFFATATAAYTSGNTVWTTSTTNIVELDNGIVLDILLKNTPSLFFPHYLIVTLKSGEVTGALPILIGQESYINQIELKQGAYVTLLFDGAWHIEATSKRMSENISSGIIQTSENSSVQMTDLLGYTMGEGYAPIYAGQSFDVNFPLVYYNNSTSITGIAQIEGECCYQLKTAGSSRLGLALTNNYTVGAPVFLVGTYNNPVFTIDSTTTWTQTVPTEEDGYYYYALGMATSTSTYTLYMTHPIYHYSNGAFREVKGTEYIASTVDIGEGAELADGVLYLVYEEDETTTVLEDSDSEETSE